MSGVYVKGMEIPRTHPITVEIYPDGTVLSKTVGRMDIHGKAVPVPPHGRLIDADILAAKCDDPYWCVWLSDIDDAPTIIPASEEGE